VPRRFAGICLASLFLAFSWGPLVAQVTSATLRGRVAGSDRTGLPGVVVTLRSRQQPTGNRQAVTDSQGNYRIPQLPVANDYVLRVACPGFAPVEVGPIDLDAGKSVVQDVTLRSGAESTETIVVESKGSIVDTESTETSSSYSAEFIEGLPIIGHNYQDILTLAPGVTDTDGDGNPNVHGARDTGLQYRLDGGNITDPMTGGYGQNLNAEMIEEIEIITSGASAEYGRADGGFANIISKSGGNDFEGNFKVYWRGKFLDGNGANRNDLVKLHDGHYEANYPNFHDLRPTLTLGGAIVRDRLWYFGTAERVESETPHNFLGPSVLTTTRGNYSFAKVTWQAGSFHKLSLQVTADPLTYEGLGLGLGVAPESDYRLQQGGLTPQLKWTSTISPLLLLETSISGFRTRYQVIPVSPEFHPTEVEYRVVDDTVQAVYPCKIDNCAPERGEHGIYQISQYTDQVTGPFYLKSDQKATRKSLKTDLSYAIEDAWGQHSIKAGFEFQNEAFDDAPITNPILFDATHPPRLGGDTQSAEEIVEGYQVLLTFDPLVTPQVARSFNRGVYLLDAWKPRPNLTINAGLRLDREDIDSSGYSFFDPRRERREGVALWRAICSAADSLDRATDDFGLVTSQNCYEYNDKPGEFDGKPPRFGLSLPLDHPAFLVTDPAVRALDLDRDGSLSSTGAEGDAILDVLTSYDERQTTNFSIVNDNLSPRLSVSWDPWADGKTKVFGTWGRFHDRLFLNTVAQEIGPDRVSYAFIPDETQVIRVGTTSLASSTTSISQTDRRLATPRTDEVTFGFERELAPEWSVGVTYVRRDGVDLLQDTDLNHITCAQHTLVGVDPRTICWDGARLDTDRFGDIGGRIGHTPADVLIVGGQPGFHAGGEGGRKLPNGSPDLYTVNYNFNEILRVENANSSQYEAWELRLVKRLHRNWQMQASYTWSEAFGQAERFLSNLGNDPETKDDEEGYLSYDQRHILKLQAVTRLPRGISLGSVVQWSSGTPWSVIRRLSEFDSTGNIVLRTIYPSRQRNDQRNESLWNVDARVEKSFVAGKVQSSAFLNIDNLLNSDYLTILQFNDGASRGTGLTSYRDFGRRFELGASFKF
jgi:outer membrane receptor protein involved in Fe transport